MRAAACIALALWAGPTPAQTDFTQLTATERRILGEAVRKTLLLHPEIITNADRPAPIYQDDITADLALIAAAAPTLFHANANGFGPPDAARTIALFTAPDCANCDQATKDLRALSQDLGIRVTLFDLQTDAALAAQLGLTIAPSYVLPDMMIRGQMPAFILRRYLTQ